VGAGSPEPERVPTAEAGALASTSPRRYNPAVSDEPRYALGFMFGPGKPDMVSFTPHAQRLGIQVVETGPCFAVVRLPYRTELIGDPGRKVIFGGAITTLLDHASGLAIACSLEELRAIATIDLRVDYLRAAEPGLDLTGRIDCYRVTRNVAFVRGTAWDRRPDDPFASCMGSFMLGANPAGSPFTRLIPGDGTEQS